MKINNKFLEILQKIGELDIVEEARNTLLSEIKDLRDKVFSNLTDTKEEDNKEHDAVNHPKHYTSHASGIECIEITRHYNFDIGNSIKYLWRAGLKKEQGLSDVEKEIEDCKKAIWYINDHIKHLKNSEFRVNGEQPNGKTF
jgi:predicted  nucleic acid-binding Zn-ribbon protein